MKACPVNVTTATSQFEWNELAKKNGTELWCIRVPSSVSISRIPVDLISSSKKKADHRVDLFCPSQMQFKSSRLQNLNLKTSMLDKKDSSKPLGTLTTSKNTYHLVPSAQPSSSSSSKIPKSLDYEQEADLRPSLVDSMVPVDQVGKGARSAGDHDRDRQREKAVKAELGLDNTAGLEEMQGLRLVVPDGQRGRFYMAPKQPSRHFILTPLVAPAAPPNDDLITPGPSAAIFTPDLGPTKKHQQPLGLKYRNVPFGAVNPYTCDVVGGPERPGARETMVAPDAAGQEGHSSAQASSQQTSANATKSSEDKEKKQKKKRKSDGGQTETPDKSLHDKEKKRKAKSSEGGSSKRVKTA